MIYFLWRCWHLLKNTLMKDFIFFSVLFELSHSRLDLYIFIQRNLGPKVLA